MKSERGLVGKLILIIIASLLMILTVTVVSSMTASLPGDLIYPFKGFVENLRLQQQEFEFRYIGSASIYLEMMQARLDEIEQLAQRRNKDKEIIATTQRLLEIQKKTINKLREAEDQEGGDALPLFNKFESILKQEQDNLPRLFPEVSQPAVESIQKVIDQSEIDLEILHPAK